MRAKALYFGLPLDVAECGELSVEGGTWAGADALALAVPAAPSELHVGVAMLHPQDQPGFSGAATVATVTITTGEGAAGAARATSAPPLNQPSRINRDYDPTTNRITWYYRSLGDYDQNGEVNISDLTQVAVHFGQSANGSFDWESVESVVDGDGNG